MFFSKKTSKQIIIFLRLYQGYRFNSNTFSTATPWKICTEVLTHVSVVQKSHHFRIVHMFCCSFKTHPLWVCNSRTSFLAVRNGVSEWGVKCVVCCVYYWLTLATTNWTNRYVKSYLKKIVHFFREIIFTKIFVKV